MKIASWKLALRMAMPIAVLKLGGSLLDLADLPDRLRSVVGMLDGDRPLLVCGGGAAADIVRGWDERFRLGDERSHWLALEAIRLNQRLLLDLLPEVELVSNRAAAESVWRASRVPLLDLLGFVRSEESELTPDERLPHTWDVTSDSLAAWVVIRWPASRLVLLKSADRGLVDAYFPTIGRDLSAVFWCNLRGAGKFEFQPFKN